MKDAPQHLSDEAAQLWRDIVRDYDVDDSAGLRLLMTACECLDRARQAQREIVNHGLLIPTKDGHKMNPACNVERDARNGMMNALRALRLDAEPARPPGRPPQKMGPSWLDLALANGDAHASPSPPAAEPKPAHHKRGARRVSRA